MTYLHVPRLVFAGRFQADTSSVNNDPEHFDTDRFRANYQLPGSGSTNGWWNPQGTGAWRFFDCRVRSVWYADGTRCDDSNIDPVVGMSINDSNQRVQGKLVDLDPEQQMVSEIWGFQILLDDPKHGSLFTSNFEVTPFADIWTRYPQGQPDAFFGAFYQSVLTRLKWQQNLKNRGSRFWEELIGRGDPPTQLSIRFNVDGFQDDSTLPWFTFGRVVGSIGHCHTDEPSRFVLGRHFVPASSTLNSAVAVLQGNQLLVDLGNSLPTVAAGGELQDLGRLYMALLPAGEDPVILGEINYKTEHWYESTAGIQAVPLSREQSEQAESTPLGLVQTSRDGTTILLQESEIFVHADPYVFRLNPGDEGSATLYATKLGEPLASQTITLVHDSSIMQGQVDQGPIVGPPVGMPEDALNFAPTVTTDESGKAVVCLTAGSPKNPRGYIDGQVYGVSYTAGDTPAASTNPSDILSVLVWDEYEIPNKPNWLRDASPIFQQYANLYPIMKPIVDLASYASVRQRIYIMQKVFDKEMDDPNYMPVTRDLSKNKREMIRKFLKKPAYMSFDGVDDVKMALQIAIELEHATLPPYLCALYSIKPGYNQEVATLIRSVVLEEMLHMALACNILIAIGGQPSIGKPGFVPRYPGPLPGGVRGNLTVRLRRCSIAQIRDVFMSIEEPATTAEEDNDQIHQGDLIEAHPYTIAWLYDQIDNYLKDPNIQFGNLERQVQGRIGSHEIYKIDSFDQAHQAIKEITDQGEGTDPLDPTVGNGDLELSHYYKFAEVVNGRRIVLGQNDGFSYTGDEIPFDPDGVYPMADDPNTAMLQAGSQARILSEQFNQTYQTLLNALHAAFNGEPGQIDDTIGLMYSLDLAARKLMETPSGRGDGTTAGPSFETPQ